LCAAQKLVKLKDETGKNTHFGLVKKGREGSGGGRSKIMQQTQGYAISD